jgi:hypothetical protein
MVNSGSMRADDGDDLLAGYVSGPAASTEATAVALARAEAARDVVLVERISDQIAVETLAGRRDRDLAAEGIAVLPAGGAHGVARYLRRFGAEGTPAHASPGSATRARPTSSSEASLRPASGCPARAPA